MSDSDRANERSLGGGYTDEERDSLLDAAASVLVATVAADRSGPIAYFSEMTAAGTYLYEARRRYADNRLVQELFLRNEERAVAEEEGPVTSEDLLENIDRIARLLRRDEEGMEFRSFLYELAERVAKASRGRPFGPRISSEEAEFLAELRVRLGLTG